ncbi:MAG: hypothetical protein R2800_07995 [Flavipsychrobacter sp.]
MQQKDFEDFKDFILSKNAYFTQGFALAYKDDVSRAVQVREGKDVKRLLPADSLSNYFYLRHEPQLKHEPKEPERLTDNGTQRLTFLDTQVVHLVAIVNHADAYQLVENLRNTAMMYDGLNVKPIATSWDRELVITSELSNMSQADITAALQRLKDETVVHIQAAMSKSYIPTNCIVNPINKEYHEQYH